MGASAAPLEMLLLSPAFLSASSVLHCQLLHTATRQKLRTFERLTDPLDLSLWLKYPAGLHQLLYQLKKPLWFSALSSVLDLCFLNTTQKETGGAHEINEKSPHVGFI